MLKSLLKIPSDPKPVTTLVKYLSPIWLTVANARFSASQNSSNRSCWKTTEKTSTNDEGACSLAASGSVGPMTRLHVVTASALDNTRKKLRPLQYSHKYSHHTTLYVFKLVESDTSHQNRTTFQHLHDMFCVWIKAGCKNKLLQFNKTLSVLSEISDTRTSKQMNKKWQVNLIYRNTGHRQFY